MNREFFRANSRKLYEKSRIMTSEFWMNSREFSIFERIFMKTSKIHVGHFLRENGMNFREFVFLIFSREFLRFLIFFNKKEFKT